MEKEFETEIVILGDDSLMSIDQYSIQRVQPELIKTDEVLNAHTPSTDVKKKNVEHVEAKKPSKMRRVASVINLDQSQCQRKQSGKK